MTVQARCVRIAASGGPEVLQLGTCEVRDPGPGEIRVAIAAAGLNRADCLQRKGVYPAPKGYPADIPGLEYAGIVEAVGEGCARKTGDRVMGITGGGAMATHIIAHGREVLPVPEGLSLEEAAAIPEAFLTAFDALFVQGGLRCGQRVLIHAIASGVGTAALQLASIAGAHVAGTSRSIEKLERTQDIAPFEALHSADGTFQPAQAPNLILDTIGAKYLKANLKALAPKGRIVTIGLLGGARGELNLGLLLAKRATLLGSVLRSRPLEEKAALAQRFAQEMLPHFATGSLKPIVEETLPMADISSAHRRMEANETFGKLVLSWSNHG